MSRLHLKRGAQQIVTRRPFTPASIAGLQLWIDGARPGVAAADGGAALPWADLSSNKQTFTNLRGTDASYRMSRTPNLRPAMNLASGAIQSSSTTLLDGMTAATIFSVSRWSAVGDVLLKISNTGSARGWAIISGGRYLLLQQDGSNWRQINTGTSYSTDNTWRLLVHWWDSLAAGHQRIYVNGGTPITADIGGGTVTTVANAVVTTVGNTAGGTDTNSSGDVAEILVYDQALDAGAINAVGLYLASKYGLAWARA